MHGGMMVLVLAAIFALCTLSEAGNKPVITTSLGDVRGFEHTAENSFKANIFLGLPYASPPVGPLRFKKPEPVHAWSDVRDATEWPRGCVPCMRASERKVLNNANNGEDCLYLNVFAPTTPSDASSGYPVMIYVHGGGYNIGSTFEYGYESLVRNFVSRGVVVVTIQYRMGPLGFFSTGDSALPGNLGYWDQTLALRFVNEHIASFGGDATKITVFGESAGAGSVGALTVSPHSRDLFAQAVEMSGATVADWAQGPRVVEDSRQLAHDLDCRQEQSDAIIDCLRSKTVEEIQDAHKKRGFSRNHPNFIKFGPRVDGDFFPKPIEELIAEAPKKPSILGACDTEGGFFSVPPMFIGNPLNVRPEEFATYNYERFEKFVREIVATPSAYGNKAIIAQELMLHHYIHSKGDWKNNTFALEKYTEFLSDYMFNVPIYHEAQLKNSNGWPTWFYSYDHLNADALPKNHPVKGAFHTMELPYIFGMVILGKYEFNEDDLIMEDLLATVLTNFAKYGNPTPKAVHGIVWEQLSSSKPHQYARLLPKPTMELTYRRDTVAFWTQLLPKLIGHSSQPTESTPSQSRTEL
uniref:Carboxylic ester hydrolase n=1 Tax=Plectus sambesii TaxID=2011161 RepID=A0A914X587_9BILA